MAAVVAHRAYSRAQKAKQRAEREKTYGPMQGILLQRKMAVIEHRKWVDRAKIRRAIREAEDRERLPLRSAKRGLRSAGVREQP